MQFRKYVWLLMFVFGILTTFKAPLDPDFGWHYKYGEYFIQHGKLLRDNIFSYTFNNYRWANSYWLSQTLIYLSHRYLGYLTAGLLFSALLSSSTLFYVKHLMGKGRSNLPVFAAVCFILFLKFSENGITVRPMFFSSLFLMFLTAVILPDSRKISLWVLPFLFLIWGNMHADFVLGLTILLLYVLVRIINILLRKEGGTRYLFLNAIFPAALSFLVTLINPYGIQLWSTLLKESHPFQFNYIMEWRPADAGNVIYFLTYYSILGLIIFSVYGYRKKVPAWYVLAVTFFCLLSVRSQYFLRIALVFGIPAVISYWKKPFDDLANIFNASTLKSLKISFLLLLGFSVLTGGLMFVKQSLANEQGYPSYALEYAVENNIRGNVFNHYSWGGYLIWKYPEIKPFVDGRMPSWRKDGISVFEEYMHVVIKPEYGETVFKKYNVGWILYPTHSRLVDYLKLHPDVWREEYSDDTASVFVIITPWQPY